MVGFVFTEGEAPGCYARDGARRGSLFGLDMRYEEGVLSEGWYFQICI
jgi:hypothetical protein